MGRLALRLAKAEALPYWSIVVETCACRMSFCCTPTGAPVSSSHARYALGWDNDDNSREIATMLYGEVRPSGHFRFVNFGHPPPLVFSAEYERFMEIGKARMMQFLPLGLAIPEDNPDRNRYLSIAPRTRKMDASDVAEITLMSPRDILFLYTDGVYDGSDEQDRVELDRVIRDHRDESAKDICN